MKLNVQSSTSKVYVYHSVLTLPFDIYSPISEQSYIRRSLNSKCESICCCYFAYKLLLHGAVILLYNYGLFLNIPNLSVDEMPTTVVEESYLCFTQILSLAFTVTILNIFLHPSIYTVSAAVQTALVSQACAMTQELESIS